MLYATPLLLPTAATESDIYIHTGLDHQQQEIELHWLRDKDLDILCHCPCHFQLLASIPLSLLSILT